MRAELLKLINKAPSAKEFHTALAEYKMHVMVHGKSSNHTREAKRQMINLLKCCGLELNNKKIKRLARVLAAEERAP